MIPSVAASERGRAQTSFYWGCRTVYMELQKLCIAEEVGKLRHRG